MCSIVVVIIIIFLIFIKLSITIKYHMDTLIYMCYYGINSKVDYFVLMTKNVIYVFTS